MPRRWKSIGFVSTFDSGEQSGPTAHNSAGALTREGGYRKEELPNCRAMRRANRTGLRNLSERSNGEITTGGTRTNAMRSFDHNGGA